MDRSEEEALFRQFAAPLTEYAAISPDRRELAELLARTLWLAVIAGPETEEQTWEFLKQQTSLDEESLQPIQEMYYEQMKPVPNEAQLAALRTRYRRQGQE